MRPKNLLGLLLILFLISVIVDLPRTVNIFGRSVTRPDISFQIGNLSFIRDLEPKLGLDLSGGSHLVFEADMANVKSEDREFAHEAARETVERRVNLFGLSEPLVQTSKVEDSHRIVVELPGVTDVGESVNLIGQTAQLEFFELKEVVGKEPAATPSAELVPTGLTGKELVRAKPEFSPETGPPVVAFEFNDDGGKKFGEITGRNIGRPVYIMLDGQVVSAPTVQSVITTSGVITGNFTLDEVKKLSVQLNAGALPVPLKIIEQRTVGPTLGKESVDNSIRAGLVGIAAVAVFMTLYYGRLGVISVVGLVMYGVFTFALFKIIPVVLTLPGVAGFLLSVGMAVDSNILIFERLKEELKRGLKFQDALEAAFGRAWDSIRDANIATLLTCFILFNPFNWPFLLMSGPIRGFALTLALGVAMSLFTGVVVTRTLLRIFARK